MSNIEPEIRKRVEDAVKTVPQIELNYKHLLRVKEDDLLKFSELYNKPEMPTTVEIQQFFFNLLDYLPPENRLAPWAALLNFNHMAMQLNVDPEIIATVVNDLYGDNNISRIINFINEFKIYYPRILSAIKKHWYAGRNSKHLLLVDTATDLRAVYNADCSPATYYDKYDPFLDFETLTPAARVRLTFDAEGKDYIDFACDSNMLNTLIHRLLLTQKQMGMLQVIADKLGKEVDDDTK